MLRKTTTIEYIERTLLPRLVDHRTSLAKLHRVTDYLRQFYREKQPIPHDDVVFAIEKTCGSDSRTIRKTIRLLLRHGYLTPVSTKKSEIVQTRKFVQVRTKNSTTTREYRVDEGFRNYVFGPRAPRSYQKKLVPPTPPSTRIDEGYSSENMCVSHSGFKASENTGESVGKAPVGAIEGEKKEEEYVLHTHISCKNTSKTAEETSEFSHKQLNPLATSILRVSEKEADPGGSG